MTEFLKGKQTSKENPAAGLQFFRSLHRIDDAYLADLLGEATPSGEISLEINRMGHIVSTAIAPVQMMAHLSGGIGYPYGDGTIGYVFGWLDVFKSHVWHVRDFNRSFFHLGFFLYFGGPHTSKNENERLQDSMTAMMCLFRNITDGSATWGIAEQKGWREARAYLLEQKPPSGPHPRCPHQ